MPPCFCCLAWSAACGATLVATLLPFPFCVSPLLCCSPFAPLCFAARTSGGRGLCQSGQLLMLVYGMFVVVCCICMVFCIGIVYSWARSFLQLSISALSYVCSFWVVLLACCAGLVFFFSGFSPVFCVLFLSSFSPYFHCFLVLCTSRSCHRTLTFSAGSVCKNSWLR